MHNFPKWMRRIFYISFAVNLVFLLLFGYFVHKRGGIRYIVKRSQSILQPDKPLSGKPKLSYPVEYFYRKSIYESLADEENEIIFLGDSITDNGEWSELFKDLRIKNRGIQGDRTDRILKRLSEVVSSSPRKIFLLVGYNDLSKGVSIDAIVANYEKIIQNIKAQSLTTQIYIQSVLPVNYNFYKGRVKNKDVIRLNRHLKQLSKQYNAHYVDLYAEFCDAHQQLHPDFAAKDGLHLNGKAYLKWKSILDDYVYN